MSKKLYILLAILYFIGMAWFMRDDVPIPVDMIDGALSRLPSQHKDAP